jgi:hypothetical protein
VTTTCPPLSPMALSREMVKVPERSVDTLSADVVR